MRRILHKVNKNGVTVSIERDNYGDDIRIWTEYSFGTSLPINFEKARLMVAVLEDYLACNGDFKNESLNYRS